MVSARTTGASHQGHVAEVKRASDCVRSPHPNKAHEFRATPENVVKEVRAPALFYCIFCLGLVGLRDMEGR